MKNVASKRNKFKLEHPNNFDTESDLTCHNVKIEPSSLGQCDEPGPAQTVDGKDISNSFMGETFLESLLLQLTQQVVEILKNDSCKEVESESPRSIESLRKEDKNV